MAGAEKMGKHREVSAYHDGNPVSTGGGDYEVRMAGEIVAALLKRISVRAMIVSLVAEPEPVTTQPQYFPPAYLAMLRFPVASHLDVAEFRSVMIGEKQKATSL
ncbi:MAG: hypothetical protein JNM70_01210 [Anaerolineae bacterium]|nr:hypothetical protein [Anaerolineae bacterium]